MEQIWAPWRIEYIMMEKTEECILCTKPVEDEDRANFMKWKKEASDLYTEEKKRVADLKKIILDVKLLKELSKYPAFYYVHTMDYRGRIYSVGDLERDCACD